MKPLVLLELLAILASVAGVFLLDRRLGPSAPVSRRTVLTAVAAVAAFCSVLLLANGPAFIETHSEVIQSKVANREACTRTPLAVERFRAISNNAESKRLARLHAEAHDASFDAQLQAAAHVVLFTLFGPMLLILPFLVLLALEAVRLLVLRRRGGRRPGRERERERERDRDGASSSNDSSDCGSAQAVLIRVRPALRFVGVVALVSSVIVNVAMPWLRTFQCLLISGHWFIYCMSCLCGCIMWAHIAASSNGSDVGVRRAAIAPAAAPRPRRRRVLLTFYSLYLAVYVALGLRVLAHTQLFHHDAWEAQVGIGVALAAMPAAIAAAALAERAYALFSGAGGTGAGSGDRGLLKRAV